MLGYCRLTLDALSRWLFSVAKWLTLFMFLLVNVEVILRYVFDSSTMISDEYSGYLFTGLTLFGFLHAARSDCFLRVEFATRRLSGGRREFVAALGTLAGLIVSGVTCYASTKLVSTSMQFHSVSAAYSQTPLFLPQLILPISFGLLSLSYVDETLRHLARAFWCR